MNVLVTAASGLPAGERDVEVVERKGIGHPDTICDGVAEAACRALCRLYLERCGGVLHHNVDKVLLVGGRAEASYGGGQVLAPIELHLAGRATSSVDGAELPVEAVCTDACRAWLRTHLRDLDAEAHVRVHCHLRPGSQDLVEVFRHQARTGIWLANDTSCGSGFAPLSTLESTVKAVAEHLQDPSFRGARPAVGEDVKVMGVRSQRQIELTVSAAFVAARIPDLRAYLAERRAVEGDLRGVATLSAKQAVTVVVNAADQPERNAVFLTVTGTSAEGGDDGEAGRGNRANGLITPMRPMNLESVAGKNPVSHVGKIYTLLANAICRDVVAACQDVRSAECHLLSRIGAPVNEPALAHVTLHAAEGGRLTPRMERCAREALSDQLRRTGDMAWDLIEGRATWGLDLAV